MPNEQELIQAINENTKVLKELMFFMVKKDSPTIAIDEAASILGEFGKSRRRKIKKMMENGEIKKWSKAGLSYVFDKLEILDLRQNRLNPINL